MDKREKTTITLKSAQATEKLGEMIGSKLKGGEVIELISDLGGGKTTMVRGIARGAGSSDHVSSPSFTLRNDYSAKEIAIAHFDFYRLSEPGILRDMLAEQLIDPETTVIIEWAQVVDDILPADHIKLRLKATSENGRELELSYPERFNYLFEGVL